jgi:hypothetical protein
MFKFFDNLKLQKQIKKSAKDFNTLWESDLNTVWTIADKNQFLIAMNGWLCRKCNYGEDIEKLSDVEKVFYFNTQLESEVNNGGFSQYFFNSSGDFANETVNSLSAIGAVQTASIYKKALLALGSELPKDRDEREELLDKILTDSVGELLSEYDAEFYKCADNLEELNYQYIINNKEQFT